MTWTKADFANYRREQRRLKPGVQAAYMRERRRQMRVVLDALKDRPCADCNSRFPPYVMDFDHVRGDKRYILAKMTMMSLERVFDEVAKCDVVCSNCHRIRTNRRKSAQIGAKNGAAARWS